MKLWLDLKLFVQYWTWKNVIEQLVSVSWFRGGCFLRIRVLQTSAKWDNQLKPSKQVGNTLQYHVCFKSVHKSCKHTTLRLYHTAHSNFDDLWMLRNVKYKSSTSALYRNVYKIYYFTEKFRNTFYPSIGKSLIA